MFCKHCGNKLEEEAIVCAKCGCLTNGEISKENQKELIVFIKAFGIINCIISCLSLVSVLWCVPMFVLLLYKLENKEYISTSFKWAYLLFCSIPVGFMLFALKLANNINENKESEKIEENSKIYTPKFILMVKCYLIISLVFMGFIFLLSMITANPDVFIISFIFSSISSIDRGTDIIRYFSSSPRISSSSLTVSIITFMSG